MSSLVAMIRERSSPLKPRPTELAPKLGPIEGIRALLFDIYGTLFVSASGDIGLAATLSRGTAFQEAVASCAMDCAQSSGDGAALLIECIAREQRRLLADGRLQAEVDIRDCWRDCLGRAAEAGLIRATTVTTADLERVAVLYECLTNPVWPMPHTTETLHLLRRRGLALGVVSNAQFFTPLLFPALLGEDLQSLGFDPDLCWFSHEHGYGKPDLWLHRRACEALEKQGISPGECLFIGNDLLNDLWPAANCGMRTALFAGDSRSLRLREGRPELANLTPDLILTDLMQLPAALAPSPSRIFPEKSSPS